MAVLFAVIVCLVILGVPCALHFDSVRLTKPVVIFRYRWWRKSWLLLLTTIINAGCVFVIARMALATGSALFASIMFLLLAAVSRLLWRHTFTVYQLHLSYWRQESNATLTFLQPEQRAMYYRADTTMQLSFLINEVCEITTYETPTANTRGPLWNSYSYQVWTLKDGTSFIITCLLSDFMKPDMLVPLARRQTVQLPICWLPDKAVASPTLL